MFPYGSPFGSRIGGLGGALVIFIVLPAAAGYMYLRSRKAPVGHHNVNDEWEDAPAAERVPAGTAGILSNLRFALQGAWKVLVAGLILGAGLPLLFAFGIRSPAYGSGGEAEVHESGVTGPRPHRIGTVVGYVLFLIVPAGVVLGITFIVASGSARRSASSTSTRRSSTSDRGWRERHPFQLRDAQRRVAARGVPGRCAPG